MKQVLSYISLFGLLFSVGCAMAAAPVNGFIFADVKGPITATENSGGSKEGQAMAQSILGAVSMGDASIDTAAKNGGITKIRSVDHHSWGILGIWAKFTTIVKGD